MFVKIWVPHKHMNMSPKITDETIIAAVPDQLTCDLAGDAAILHLPDGLYYGLNETGAFLWERIQQPTRVANLHSALVEEFDVSGDDAARDLFALLDELMKVNLIEVRDEAAS